jgi:cell division protein FtsW
LSATVAEERRPRSPGGRAPYPRGLDQGLLLAVAALLSLGLVMVASASLHLAERAIGEPLYYLVRHGSYLALGLLLGIGVWYTPIAVWERIGRPGLLLGMLLLLAVLIPGVGKSVNGSVRWLPVGPFHLQVSEWMKLFAVVYLAGYMLRRHEQLGQSLRTFINPFVLLGVACLLMFLEPDFGAGVVVVTTACGMLFLGGASLVHLGLAALAAGAAFAGLVLAAPYRLERITAFLDPWADPYDSGFQLAQALIAFGRGQELGVGLGASVQKLFYLPEAHTDFLFAVIAEETGLVGTLGVIALFAYVVWRAFAIGRLAERAEIFFGAHLAYGIGLWIGLQAMVNMAVNMGALPTKGLTLPLMSYGGNSMLVCCIAMALLLRVHREAQARGPAAIVEREPWPGGY